MEEYLKIAFKEGWDAYHKGIQENGNPYKPSGHERDTTFEDERHAEWWRGWNEAEELWLSGN